MSSFLGKLIHLPLWWYKDSLVGIKRFFRNLLVFLDNKLAVRLMLKMMLTPLFHDVSFLGRILSFVFRLIRVVVGSLIILLTMMAMIVCVVFWRVWLVELNTDLVN
ncbi:hypothetical protein ACFL18_01330 [Patescibacteria group bacterium]